MHSLIRCEICIQVTIFHTPNNKRMALSKERIKFNYPMAERKLLGNKMKITISREKSINYINLRRYIADNDGYRADVSYLIDKNSVGFQESNGYNLESKSDQQHVNVQPYNPIFDANVISTPLHPIPSASTPIFVSTVKPPIDIHHVLPDSHFKSNKLSFEDRKSISAKPTYVVSAKSTHINDEAIRIEPNGGPIDDNELGLSTPAIYFRQQYHQHHPVFYKTHH